MKAAAGIRLTPDRAPIAAARIARRLRATGSKSFKEYAACVEQDSSRRELWTMIDALTVNQTSFYREPIQFPVFLAGLREQLRNHETVNVWSAGCSTGEEVLTLAMLAHALVPDAIGRVRFLGTDISSSVLKTARTATYTQEQLADLPSFLRPLLDDLGDGTGRMRVNAQVRRTVSFARHNLVGVWQMRGPMHIIFCRNVLLYFDRPTQRTVIDGFCNILSPGGYLFLGSTETVTSSAPLRALEPSIYHRIAS